MHTFSKTLQVIFILLFLTTSAVSSSPAVSAKKDNTSASNTEQLDTSTTSAVSTVIDDKNAAQEETAEISKTQPSNSSANTASSPYNNKYIIGIGEKVRLDFPKKWTPTDYIWESSKEKVAHVGRKGKVTGLKKGKAIITCSDLAGNILYTFQVKVKKAPKKLTLSSTEISLFPTQKATLSFQVNKKAACQKVTFLSQKDDIAKVSKKGVITAKKSGKTKITVSTYNGLTAACMITVKSSDKLIALTFDDGPHSQYTPKLLNALKEQDCHATFFLLGYLSSSNKQIVNDIVANGHELGVHSWNHSNYAKLTSQQVTDDITKASQALYHACQQYPTLMRPPYGSYTSDTLAVMQKQNLPVVLWNIDIKDWNTSSKAKVKQDLLSQSRDGAVFVLHDSHQSTVDAVIEALPILKKQGYEFVTVSELAALKKQTLSAGKIYYGK